MVPSPERQDLLILVNTHEIEPIMFLCAWLVELGISILEGPVEPFIPHIAHAIKGQLGVSFLQQYRLDLNLVCFRDPSVVVD